MYSISKETSTGSEQRNRSTTEAINALDKETATDPEDISSIEGIMQQDGNIFFLLIF